MFLNPSIGAALDRIAERAADVRRAFTPGATADNDDVATAPAADPTIDGLSVACANDAYFVTAERDGTNSYTRDGSFRFAGGTLVTQSGNPVLGTTAGGKALSELQLDPVDAALGRVLNARIERDGTLAYDRAAIDPRSGRRELVRVTLGRIAMARFPAGTRPASADGERFGVPAGVVPHVGSAGDGTFAPLETNRRMRAGIDLDASIVRLKEAYLAFDALQAAHSAKGRTSKTAMDLVK
jgi:hypothetical protein